MGLERPAASASSGAARWSILRKGSGATSGPDARCWTLTLAAMVKEATSAFLRAAEGLMRHGMPSSSAFRSDESAYLGASVTLTEMHMVMVSPKELDGRELLAKGNRLSAAWAMGSACRRNCLRPRTQTIWQCRYDELSDGKLESSVDTDEEQELALGRLHFRDVDVKEP